MSNPHQVTDKLFLNWSKLLQIFDIHPTTIENTFNQIVVAYSSPNRFYHNLEHINHVLEVIQTLESQIQNINTIQFAAWYHDIIYDTKTKDNEEQSAEYALTVLSSLSIPSNIIQKVRFLILTTKNHQISTNDVEAQALLDADLAILGSRLCEYNKYAESIRQEYIWIPEVKYFTTRKQVLQKFLQRDNIYFTQLMQQEKEQAARNNLQREIAQINLQLQCDN